MRKRCRVRWRVVELQLQIIVDQCSQRCRQQNCRKFGVFVGKRCRGGRGGGVSPEKLELDVLREQKPLLHEHQLCDGRRSQFFAQNGPRGSGHSFRIGIMIMYRQMSRLRRVGRERERRRRQVLELQTQNHFQHQVVVVLELEVLLQTQQERRLRHLVAAPPAPFEPQHDVLRLRLLVGHHGAGVLESKFRHAV